MSDQPTNIAHEVRAVISRVVGCKSVPACDKHREIVNEMFLALSGRFTFVALPGDNTIDTADVAPIDKQPGAEDMRPHWAPAVRRVQRRLRGLIVLDPLGRDLELLEGIARSLEDVFGARP